MSKDLVNPSRGLAQGLLLLLDQGLFHFDLANQAGQEAFGLEATNGQLFVLLGQEPNLLLHVLEDSVKSESESLDD